jgi:cytoskeletal protein CcmA (bactofilin family)
MATYEWETLSSTRPAARSGSSTPPGNGSDGDHRSLVLGPRDRLVGQLYVEGDLRVIGTVEGGLEVMGSVEIDEGGKVTGPVTARDRLVVGRAGSLKGDVRVARLVVQDGATFSGNVSMGKFVETPPKPIEVVEPATEPEPVKLEEAIRAPQAPQPARPAQPARPPQVAKQSQPVKPPQPARPQQPTKPAQAKGKRR